MRANRSGYSANTPPGTFIVIEALKKPEIFCSTRLSKVELHARATLAVPGEESVDQRTVHDLHVVIGVKTEPCDINTLTYHIGEDEVPPRDEGPDFSNRDVAVKVRGARFGDTGAEFGVAQAGQHGGQSSGEETEDDGGSRLFSGNLAGQDVDAGAERGAHPQGDEVQGGQATGKLRLLTGAVEGPATQQGLAKVGQLAGHIRLVCGR